MTATFEQSDYLCIGPFCWGRAKTAREAYRAARSNWAQSLVPAKDATFAIWRLPDQTDIIEVDDFGRFTSRPGEGHEKTYPGRLVWKDTGLIKPTQVPEQMLTEVDRETGEAI